MSRVRFYYDVYVDEDDIMENCEYENKEEITEKDVVDRVHCEVMRQSKSGQLYFISVYEGDKSYAGRQTKPNCWQRNETTDMYLFNKEALKRKVITSQLGSCFVF